LTQTIAGLASDRRIQLLLIGFSFGAFIEGAAGFGTPVAICGAMLIGLGFKPLQAAGLALLGNTAPVSRPPSEARGRRYDEAAAPGGSWGR